MVGPSHRTVVHPMSEAALFELILRLLGGITTIGAGVLAWLYFRKLGGEVAQARLNLLNSDIISAYETRVRLLSIEIEDLTKELALTQRTLARMKHEAELIG